MRSRSDQGKQRMQQCYRRLLAITSRVAGQAKRFAQEVASGCKRSVDLLEQMTLEAPLPQDIQNLLEIFRKGAN